MLTIALLAVTLNVRPDSYVFIRGHETYVEGGSLDFNCIHALRDEYGPNYFYFRIEGAEYVIVDPAVLKQIDSLFEPQFVLSRKQAEIGGKQAELGSKQAALGARQAELGAAQASARDEATQQRLSANQDELSKRQEALGREQQALGDIQNDLGDKQNAMSREIKEKIRTLARDWIRSGAAKPLKR